jgi:hypothetical protein
MAENPETAAFFPLDRQRGKFCFFKERLTCREVPQGQLLTRYPALGDIPDDEHPDEFFCLGEAAANKKNPQAEDRSQKETMQVIRNWMISQNKAFYLNTFTGIKSRIL